MNTKLTPQAVHLLKRVKEQILKEPERYDQLHWCGTSFCIAGWVCHLVDGKIVPNTEWRAREILQINDEKSTEIFYGCSAERCAYSNPNHASRAAAGAKHIDDFIAKHT